MSSAEPEQQRPRDIPIAKLPQSVAFGGNEDGQVLFRVSNPCGAWILVFSPEEALAIGERLAAVGRQLATQSARHKLVLAAEVPRLNGRKVH